MSFLNGLSSLGQGIQQFAGAAGLELQRGQLATQAQILADQLATVRETKLQGQQQAFQAGESDLNRKAHTSDITLQEGHQDTRNATNNATSRAISAASIAGEDRRNAANRQAAMELEKLRQSDLSPAAKLLRDAGLDFNGNPIAGRGAPATSIAPAAETTPVPNGNGLVIDPKTGNMSTPNAGGLGAGSSPAPSGGGTASVHGSGMDEIQNPVLRNALGLSALGSPAAIRTDIAKDVNNDPSFKDSSPGQKAAEVEKRYDTAKTMGGLGGREGVQFGRVAPAATMAAEATKNIMELPSSSSTGWFGGRVQGHSLMAAVKESLANSVTSQEVQSYNVMLSGVARNLSTIETSGLAPNAGFTKSMESVILKEGDSELTKMRKMAEIRQIVEFGLEPALVNPRLPDVQKDQLRGVIEKIKAAVPFTHHDITVLETADGSKTTMNDVMKARGLGGGGASTAPEAAAAIPSWAKPGDQYSPSLGKARATDGTLYGPPQ